MSKQEILNTKIENLDGTLDFGKLRKFDNFYFSGIPTKEGLKKLKELGITKIIDFNETEASKDLAAELGIEYINVPVGGCAALSVDKIRDVNSQLDHSEKTLIHCLSGNRVGSWFAAHLFLTHNLDAKDAISKAQEAGLDNENVLEGTKDILHKFEEI